LQLAYERDLLNVLLENTPDGIYFKDLQSRFVRVGKHKLEMALEMARAKHRLAQPEAAAGGWPAELASAEAFAGTLAGKTDFDFYTEDRARPAFEDEQQIIRSGAPLIGKVERTVYPDGGVRWCLTTKMPWRDKEGRIIGTFGVSRDITAIKEAEAKLEEAHRKLVETSRQAGMAEVATGVLHNVGNVLNSVNVSANLLAERLKTSKAPNLAKAAALLREHAGDLGLFLTREAKGQQLPGYLGQLGECLLQEQTTLFEELASLTRNVEHIKHIVAMQQNYARVAGVSETIPPAELVEDALRINAAALARHRIEVVREFDPRVPPVTVDKHKVLQILINVIRNAKYACDESGHADKQLHVRVANGEGRIRISVADNGVGIPAENLTRIFSLGFTTRKGGHGFGLHSGALAARELGGVLLARSDGAGRGATFTLELPLQPRP